jgi:acylphosphatase
MQKVKMIAQGRVQGVGFRWGVYRLALELGGITGRVWNNDDGTVEILAQAESSATMAKFVQEIRKGPTSFSDVTYLDVELSNFPSYSDFKIAN